MGSPRHESTRALAKWAKWLALTTGGQSVGWGVSAFFLQEEIPAIVLLPGIACAIAQWSFFKPLPRAILWIVPGALTSPLLGYAFLVMLGHSYPQELDPPLYARVIAASVLLAIIGLAQFFVLRRWFINTGLWIPTTTIAWLIAFLLLDALKYAQPSQFFSILPAFLQLAGIGAFFGAVQGTITGVFIASLQSRPVSGA